MYSTILATSLTDSLKRRPKPPPPPRKPCYADGGFPLSSALNYSQQELSEGGRLFHSHGLTFTDVNHVLIYELSNIVRCVADIRLS
uniref:Uncharacterized protein n=1 Tax=Parascaris equorum TaxID=6256 RepID=A0A914RV97_PAREQ